MKNTDTRTATLILAASSLLFPGCAAPLGTATNTYVGDQAGKQDEYLGDRDLAKKFVLLNVLTEKTDGRLERVQFDLKNTTSADLAIEWSIEWKDANGFRIDTNPHWQHVMVAGMGFQSIQAHPPSPDAVMFQLQVRKPTPVR